MKKSKSPVGVGGRTKKAPYETQHYRIPKAIKPYVEELANNYRWQVSEFEDPQDPELLESAIMRSAYIQRIIAEFQILSEDCIYLELEDKKLVDRVLRYSLNLKVNQDPQIKERIIKIIALLQ